MKKGKILFLASALAVTLVACEKDENDNNNSEAANAQDANFVPQASLSNQSEISAGSIASQRAANAGIRNFGQMMVSDYSTAQAQLQTAANNVHLSINTDTSSLAAMGRQLMALSGRAFDSTYIAMQVAAHQTTLALLQAEASAGLSASLRAYATAQIPHVQQHLQMADSLRRAL